MNDYITSLPPRAGVQLRHWERVMLDNTRRRRRNRKRLRVGIVLLVLAAGMAVVLLR